LTLAGACLVIGGQSLYAGEFWDKKDPSQWTGEEIDRLTTKSPWAKSVTAQGTPRSKRWVRAGIAQRRRLPARGRHGRPDDWDWRVIGIGMPRGPWNGRPAQRRRQRRPNLIRVRCAGGKRPTDPRCAEDSVAGGVCQPLCDRRPGHPADRRAAPGGGGGGSQDTNDNDSDSPKLSTPTTPPQGLPRLFENAHHSAAQGPGNGTGPEWSSR
jgi:hypothetical protein